MPNSGTRPSSPRTVSTWSVRTAGSPGPLAIEHGPRVGLEDRVRVPGAGHDERLEPARGERSGIERLQPRSRTVTRGPEPSAYGSAVPTARSSGRPSIGGSASARACSSSTLASPRAQRSTPPSRIRNTSARVSTSSSATTPCSRKPGRERRPRGADDHALALDPLGLDATCVDAVVADERVAEAEHLRDVARIGDRFLVAGHGRREAGLARSDARRADGAAGEHRAVLQDEVASSLHHLHGCA